MIKRVCKICGKKFMAHQYRIEQGYSIYCSRECFHVPRQLIIKNTFALVPLTRNYYSKIDLDDVDRVSKYKWCIIGRKNKYYAQKTDKNRQKITLHRYIMNINNPKIFIDHKNHDTLDNRKSNLRICNNAENLRNSYSYIGTSKYKGVCYDKSRNKWVSNIMFNRKGIYLGHYANEIKAAKAYNQAALKYFGEFALLNDI